MAAAVAMTAVGVPTIGAMGWIPVLALGHFFLFCNVFRIHRRLELIWSAIFVLNVGITALVGEIDWLVVLGLQSVVTAAVIAYEMRQPRYHGIGARRINSRHIDDYLAGRVN